MKTQTEETHTPPKDTLEYYKSVLKYPVFHVLCPELSEEEFLAMRNTVCGLLFDKKANKA